MIRTPALQTFQRLVAVALAVTYFFFQVEPFEEEFLENHRGPAEGMAFAKPSVTWESFDKSNAPKAFTVEATVALGPLRVIPADDGVPDPCAAPSHPVRDKSPPRTSA